MWTMIGAVATACAVVASAVVAAVIWKSNARIYEIQKRQHSTYLDEQRRQSTNMERQKNLDSARLVLSLDSQMRTGEFREVLNQVQHGWDKEFDMYEYQIHLIRYLNFITVICSFYEDGVLTEKHMVRHYDNTLMAFDDNNWVHEHIKNTEENVLIRRRLEEIRKHVKRTPTLRRPYPPSPSSEPLP